MLFDALRITCQISLRLYIYFSWTIVSSSPRSKSKRFSKDQKVFKKTNRSSKSGFVFCGVLNLFSLNLTDEVHLTRYQISLLSVQNKRSMKMLYKNNVFWSVFIFRRKNPLQSGASGGAMLLLVFSVAYWPDNTEALLFIDCW